MSPKVSRPDRAPDDEPDEPEMPDEPEEARLPPGHVPMRPPAGPKRPPKPKPLPLWLKIGGYVVLLAATVGTVVYLGRPEDPRSSAQGTAELVATALSDGDLSAFRSYVCDSDTLKLPDDWAHLGKTTVLAVSDEHDDVATATLTLSLPSPTDLALLLRSEDDQWCAVTPSICPLADDAAAPLPGPDLCAGRPGRG
jgi:hypothetical protein